MYHMHPPTSQELGNTPRTRRPDPAAPQDGKGLRTSLAHFEVARPQLVGLGAAINKSWKPGDIEEVK
jgi:hypothetical protein